MAKIVAVIERPGESSSAAETKPRLCLDLEVIILRLSRSNPTRSSAEVLGRTNLRISCCVRSLAQQFPFTFSWQLTELFSTFSGSRLRVYRIDFRNHLDGKNKTNKMPVFTVRNTIFLPRSSRNRTVQLFPPLTAGAMWTVIIGPRYGDKPTAGIGVYLSDDDLGDWVDIEDKEGESARMIDGRQQLEGLYEDFDLDDDCDLIPL